MMLPVSTCPYSCKHVYSLLYAVLGQPYWNKLFRDKSAKSSASIAQGTPP